MRITNLTERLFRPLILVTTCLLGVAICLSLCCVRNAMADEVQPAIKNVVFIVSDDLKASVLGSYHDPLCRTPNIDKLASQGVVFDRAYCQGTWCAPSRQSFMFSRYQGRQGVNLGEHLQNHGLYSARVGKIYHMRVPGDIIAGTDGQDVPSTWTERFNAPGLEAHTPGDYACLNLNVFTSELENRQSTAMPHRMFVTVKYDGDGSDQPDHKAATTAIKLLRQHQNEAFFLAVGFVRPHYPMVAPRQYFQPYPWQEITLPKLRDGGLQDIPKLGIARTNNWKNPIGNYPDNQKRMWSGYYATVEFMDQQLGRVVDELDRLGLRDSTAIVFLSDHGYHLGEHGFWEKSNLHEEVVRVPLVISAPGFKPSRSDSIVELVDLYPTICELLNLPVPDDVQGVSLVPVMKDPSATIKLGAMSFHNGISWRTDDWHLMRYNDGSMELYEMQSDPLQHNNLADDPQHAAKQNELIAALDLAIKHHRIRKP